MKILNRRISGPFSPIYSFPSLGFYRDPSEKPTWEVPCYLVKMASPVYCFIANGRPAERIRELQSGWWLIHSLASVSRALDPKQKFSFIKKKLLFRATAITYFARSITGWINRDADIFLCACATSAPPFPEPSEHLRLKLLCKSQEYTEREVKILPKTITITKSDNKL